MSASYAPTRTVPGGLPAELLRLRAQADLTWAEEWQILAPRVHPGKALLDLGCGPGDVTGRIRAAVPDVRVVGLEPDIELGSLAAQRMPNLLRAYAERLPLRSGSVGTVLARFVLQHLPDLPRVLGEIRRVLVPGGWFVAIDIDEAVWGVCHPAATGLDAIYTAAASVQSDNGGNRAVVRSLTRLFLAAGFHDVALKPFAVDSGTHANVELGGHLAPDRLIPAVAAGAISAGQYGQALAAHQRFLSSPDAYAMLLGFAVVGRASAPDDCSE